MENSTKDTPSLAELLLDEFTHRINNELAALIAIVSQERAMHRDDTTGCALKRVHARLVNVGRIQHALQGPRLGRDIDASQYLRQLCESVSRATLEGTEVHFLGSPVIVDAGRCRRLGMIVSELIENARKHAFGGGRGLVCVEFGACDGCIECRVSDEGRGFAGAPRGRGLTIVNALAASLNGSITQEPAAVGTTWVLTLPITH